MLIKIHNSLFFAYFPQDKIGPKNKIQDKRASKSDFFLSSSTVNLHPPPKMTVDTEKNDEVQKGKTNHLKVLLLSFLSLFMPR